MRQTHPPTPLAAALASLGLAALLGLTALPTLAQAGPPPDGPGGGPGAPPPDGFGGGQGAPPGDFGGGQGAPAGGGGAGTDTARAAVPNDNGPQGGAFGGASQRQIVAGTVSAVDSAARTLTVMPQGGSARTIKVGPDVPITTQQDVSVSDLKVGDRIAVQGAPSGITVSQLTVGSPPAGLMGGGFGGGRAGQNGTRAGRSFATASGTITTLPSKTDGHLALALGTDAVLYLKVTAGTRVTRYASLTLSAIKVGDRAMAAGQGADDGSLSASVIGINLVQDGPGAPTPVRAAGLRPGPATAP